MPNRRGVWPDWLTVALAPEFWFTTEPLSTSRCVTLIVPLVPVCVFVDELPDAVEESWSTVAVLPDPLCVFLALLLVPSCVIVELPDPPPDWSTVAVSFVPFWVTVLLFEPVVGADVMDTVVAKAGAASASAETVRRSLVMVLFLAKR